jgi:hypothetical protein
MISIWQTLGAFLKRELSRKPRSNVCPVGILISGLNDFDDVWGSYLFCR